MVATVIAGFQRGLDHFLAIRSINSYQSRGWMVSLCPSFPLYISEYQFLGSNGEGGLLPAFSSLHMCGFLGKSGWPLCYRMLEQMDLWWSDPTRFFLYTNHFTVYVQSNTNHVYSDRINYNVSPCKRAQDCSLLFFWFNNGKYWSSRASPIFFSLYYDLIVKICDPVDWDANGFGLFHCQPLKHVYS